MKIRLLWTPLALLVVLALAACNNTPREEAQIASEATVVVKKLPEFQLSFVLGADDKYYGNVKILWNFPGSTVVLGRLEVYHKSQSGTILKALWLATPARQASPGQAVIGPFSRSDTDYCLNYTWYASSGSKPPINPRGTLITFCMADQPPSVTVNATDGQRVFDYTTYSWTYQINLTTNATDDRGVTQVELFVTDLDGNTRLLGTATDPAASWNFIDTWSTSVRSGNYSFKAVVTDTSGQTSSTELLVPIKIGFVLKPCYSNQYCNSYVTSPFVNDRLQVLVNGVEVYSGSSAITTLNLKSGDVIRLIVTDSNGVCENQMGDPYASTTLNNLNLFAAGLNPNNPDLTIPLNNRISCDPNVVNPPNTVMFDQSYTITF